MWLICTFGLELDDVLFTAKSLRSKKKPRIYFDYEEGFSRYKLFTSKSSAHVSSLTT